MGMDSSSVAVVTGAGSGIGRALAIRIGRERIGGIAVADVNESGLRETVAELNALGVKVSSHVVDVSDYDQMKRFAESVISEHGRVSHLINNAGVGLIGTFEQISIEDFEWLMKINFWGVVYGCKIFLPILRQQEAAHIINVSNVFGLIAPEEQSAYCSSKFAVRGFTESLRHEMAGTNISVSCVHPGGIKTNIARNSRVGKDTPEEWKVQGTKFFDKVAKTSSDEAAEIIIRGIRSRDPRILIGKDAQAISTISRLFPRKYLAVLERLSGHKMSLRKKFG